MRREGGGGEAAHEVVPAACLPSTPMSNEPARNMLSKAAANNHQALALNLRSSDTPVLLRAPGKQSAALAMKATG